MHRSRMIFLLLPACLLLSSACASVSGRYIGPNEDLNKKTKGLRYFLPAPYLFVREPVVVYQTEDIYAQAGTKLCKLQDCGGQGFPDDFDRIARAAGQVVVMPGGEIPRPIERKRDPLRDFEKAGNAKEQAQSGEPSKLGLGLDDKGGSGEEKPAPAEGESPVPPAKPADTSAVSIVWLPDYCHLYSVKITTVLARQETTLKLADGWRLESVQTEQDSTEVASKFLDLASAYFGGESKGEEEGEEPKKDGAEAQAGIDSGAAEKRSSIKPRIEFYRRIEKRILKPGVYSIVSRGGTCDAVPDPGKIFQDGDFATAVEWQRIEPAAP